MKCLIGSKLSFLKNSISITYNRLGVFIGDLWVVISSKNQGNSEDLNFIILGVSFQLHFVLILF